MRVLVLTSGGDAPGMNMVIYQIYKKFGKDAYACRAGFKGLINNDIAPISVFKTHKFSVQAGSIIKCSRCPKFKTKSGFEKALENAKKFDVVVILGGNGSYKGACELAQHGVRTVYIPSTIDNDVEISDYSQGYHTAIEACQNMIQNIRPTMEAFDRCCVYETMGRKCNKIANAVYKLCEGDYLITNKDEIDYDEIASIITKKYNHGRSSTIILRENVISMETLIKNISAKCPDIEIKGCKIGYVQRGTAPTSVELDFAKLFAKYAIHCIINNTGCSAIVYRGGDFEVIESFNNNDAKRRRFLGIQF